MCVLGVKRKKNFLKSEEKDPDMWRRELKAFSTKQKRARCCQYSDGDGMCRTNG